MERRKYTSDQVRDVVIVTLLLFLKMSANYSNWGTFVKFELFRNLVSWNGVNAMQL